MTDNKPLIGIDLGTTNSLVAVWREGKAELIPNVLGDYLTPSVVSIDNDGQILVGKSAKSRLITHPLATIAAFKRFMGTGKTFSLNGQQFTSAELSALVLKSLKHDAEAFLNCSVVDVVISVPAYFSDEQRKQTQFSAELAGLNVIRLINEPTAAAMAYGLDENKPEHSLIFDLGGGTFDVTVLEYDPPLIEVHSSTGDNFLGGEDFTQVLLDVCIQQWQIDKKQIDATSLARLQEAVEQVKCRLGRGDETLKWQWQDKEWTWVLNENIAKKIWTPLLAKVRAPIEQALRDAKISAEKVDRVILVGGSTRLGVVQQMVSTLFGKLPYRHLDPDTVVALGAASQAACWARDKAIEEVILTDVCPYTLGIASRRDDIPELMFSPIIERNTVIPASRVERFSTTYAGQDKVEIKVYQGERPIAKDNILVDSFMVNVPVSREIVDFEIRFSYDINGLLEIDVLFGNNDANHSHVIDRSPIGLTEEERQKSHERLSKLKIHPRDTLPNRTLLARLEQAWEQTLGDERERVSVLLSSFIQVLEKQDNSKISIMRKELSEILDQLRL